jgi:hypothetical protein
MHGKSYPMCRDVRRVLGKGWRYYGMSKEETITDIMTCTKYVLYMVTAKFILYNTPNIYYESPLNFVYLTPILFEHF